MIYRIITQEAWGFGYSSAYDSLDDATVWAGDLQRSGVEVLRFERSDGEVIPMETLSAALSAREPLSRPAGASA